MSLEHELQDLEEEYPYQTGYMQRQDLMRINEIRTELGLPQVDVKLSPVVEEDDFEEEETIEVQEPVEIIDLHEEAREVYQAYLDKQEKRAPDIAYGDYIAREVTRGRGMTPVMPLAVGGTGGGPILCDHCHKAIPLEGGAFQGVAADIAWARHPDPPDNWISYISGGLITMHAINGTIRFYHGYQHNPKCCFNLAMAEEDAAMEEFNANREDRSHEYRLLRAFFKDEFTDLDDQARAMLLVRVTNTLYNFDPGVGINRPN